MLIQGSAKSKRTEILVKKYCALLENGVRAQDILVLVQNSFKKADFIEKMKQKIRINHFENPQIHTFYGLCYNTVMNNWAFVESKTDFGDSVIIPHLCGLEISQFMLRQVIKEVGFKDYNSKLNLIHQLFRRFSLITNNNLSEKEVKNRSKVLKEVFDEDLACAINLFRSKTLQYRAFDYIRQLNIFDFIYKNTDYFKNIKYLIIDDADEITPAETAFLKHILPQLTDSFIGYDKNGSSRLGFLNTDIKTVENLENMFNNHEILNLDEIDFPEISISFNSCTRRLEMLQKALETVEKLVKSGAKPEEISIITPVIDNTLKFSLQEFLAPRAIDCQFISGSEKLCENPLVKSTLTMLKMSIGEEVDIFSIRSILCEILNIPLKYCLKIIENYNENKTISFFSLGYQGYDDNLRLFIDVLTEINDPKLLLSGKILILYEKLFQKIDIQFDLYKKFAFFMKQIQDFENVFELQKSDKIFQKMILTQLENSIISENPSTLPDFKEKSMIVATPQKIIDFGLKTKYQIWLDLTSHEWQHDDFGVLYNAWVFQKSWDKESFTNDDNLAFSELKTRKMLRKLAILANEKVFVYLSLYDNQGVENFGTTENILFGLHSQQNSENGEIKSFDFNFVPRDDQKPIFDYKNGSMAISAVPGAGKTTVLLALVIDFLKKGVSSDNIFVLTYMDSAARNFKERIKSACPNLEKLPNISTIHGLALRILKENTNYARIGLDENFEVCDESQRQRILREAVLYCQLDNEDFDKYDRGISILKLSNIDKIPFVKDAELVKFLKLYKTYNLFLKRKNLIDYDDMLRYSVNLLKNNPEIARYYQNICKFIIEDEAQDSSSIQQDLLGILSGKYKNLIRCGDINQSITTTFTNANLEGFKNFVNTTKNVSMTRSQRCAKGVFELANSLISAYCDTFKNAFCKMMMKEVKGKNPISENTVISEIFDDFNEEKSFMLAQIRKIFASDKNASVAILVRNNNQTEELASYFSGFGYDVISGNEALNRQPVFNIVYALLNFCAHPWQNETVVSCANVLFEQKLLDLKNDDFDFLNSLKTPFVLLKKDEIPSQALTQFLWDLNYWLENSSLAVEDFAIKAGLYYFNTELEKSNTYITSTFLKSLKTQYSSTEGFLNRLEEIKSRPIGSKYKFFEKSGENNQNITQNAAQNAGGTVQIMTYHKSKGGEFDFVFIPALNEEFLQFKPENIKIKSKERFLEAIKALNLKYKKKNEQELKYFQIEENLRLLYVAITRAKRRLYITSAKNYKKFGKIKKVEPSMIFYDLLGPLGEKNAK